MKRRVHVTSNQLDKLIAELRALPSEPVGEHLVDDEFVGYAMEALKAEDQARLDEHLASCPECAIEMERLVEASEVWRGEQGERQLAHLREQALATLTKPSLLDVLAEQLANVLLPDEGPSLAAVSAATPRTPKDGQTADGTLHWGIVESEETGTLTVRFSSHHLELEGVKLRLRAGG